MLSIFISMLQTNSSPDWIGQSPWLKAEQASVTGQPPGNGTSSPRIIPQILHSKVSTSVSGIKVSWPLTVEPRAASQASSSSALHPSKVRAVMRPPFDPKLDQIKNKQHFLMQIDVQRQRAFNKNYRSLQKGLRCLQPKPQKQ